MHTVMYFVFGTWQLSSTHNLVLIYLFALIFYLHLLLSPVKWKVTKYTTRVLLMCVI